MAKKVRKDPAKRDTVKEFHFPEFDVRGFIEHELEQSYATTMSLVFAVVVALASWRLSVLGSSLGSIYLPALTAVALLLGIVCAVAVVLMIGRARPRSSDYRKGDWASLIVIYLFFWLGFWALFLNP
jgi:di/tricarboxylate transporter